MEHSLFQSMEIESKDNRAGWREKKDGMKLDKGSVKKRVREKEKGRYRKMEREERKREIRKEDG